MATQSGQLAPQAPGTKQQVCPFWIVVGPPKQVGPGGLTWASAENDPVIKSSAAIVVNNLCLVKTLIELVVVDK